MKTCRAAIIGCGDVSPYHADAYAQAGVEVVAGADISDEALARFRRHVGAARAYEDYLQMLERERPDLVSICTHAPLHCEMVVAAAGRGARGIICEKPMAMTLAEADRMLEACRASGTKLTVNHQRYYESPYVRARGLLAEGAIGAVRCAEAHCRESTVLGDGTHAIHMLLSLLNWPGRSHVLAQLNRLPTGDEHARERGGLAFLAFENGCWAYLTWGRALADPEVFLHPGFGDRYYQSFVIHGDHARVEVATKGPKDKPQYLRLLRGSKAREIHSGDPGPAEAREVEDLLRSIETNSPHPLDGQTGREVMEVIAGIHESARRGSVVAFPVEASA